MSFSENLYEFLKLLTTIKKKKTKCRIGISHINLYPYPYNYVHKTFALMQKQLMLGKDRVTAAAL